MDRSAVEIQGEIPDPNIMAKQAGKLFTLPDIYLRLQRLLREPNSTIEQMAELISIDAGMSARLLKIANSSFYNYPAQVDSITRAITLIGSRELNNLVLATSVSSVFTGIPQRLLDMDGFWHHNVNTALVARSLANKMKVPDVERIFLVGLLHNVGKLAVISQMEDDVLPVLQHAPDQVPWEREAEILGFTFAACGAELLKLWRLPQPIAETVAFQHQPQQAPNEKMSAALLHVASRAASWVDQQTSDVEDLDYLQHIDPWVWDYTGLVIDDMDSAIEFAQVESWNLLGLITSSVR